jgi:hypothetical protein
MERVKKILTASLCVALGAGSVASAQNYDGVSPGSDVVPINIATHPGEVALVTWPGFQMLPDGGSRVFVQTSIEVKPELRPQGANWAIFIPGVSLPQGNARLPLDTHFFNTPVKTTRIKPHEDGVLLILELRSKTQPKLSTEKASNGYFFSYVEFPPGDYK